jgi:hypothetical protein
MARTLVACATRCCNRTKCLYVARAQRQSRTGCDVSAGGATRRRYAADRRRLPRRLELVRRHLRAQPRVGLRSVFTVRLSRKSRAVLYLRAGLRRPHRDILDRFVLGQLLSRPALVRSARLLGWASAATPRAASGTAAAPRAAATAGSTGAAAGCRGPRRTTSGRESTTAAIGWTSPGRSAAGHGTAAWRYAT